METVLVTGGAGFIGAHLVQELVRGGQEVVILDNFSGRHERLLKEERVNVLCRGAAPRAVIRGDIMDRPLLRSIFEQYQFSQVVHLAAVSSVVGNDVNPGHCANINITGTLNILEAAAVYNVRHVVFASSAAVYLDAGKPHRETDVSYRPQSLYGTTKATAGHLCALWQDRYNMPITTMRFFNIYGPWCPSQQALISFAEAIRCGREIIIRGSKTARDFVYIDDCVRAISLALEARRGGILNVSSRLAVTVPEVVDTLAAAMKEPVRVRKSSLLPEEVRHSCGDNSLIRKELSWEPTTSFREGVTRFAEWHRDWYVPSLAGQVIKQKMVVSE